MSLQERIIGFVNANRDQIVRDLCDCISIPSVNNSVNWETDNEYDVQQWIAGKFRELDLEVDMWAEDELGKRPNVVATWKGQEKGRSLMFNGHCDVVPVTNPENWQTDPFVGTVVGDRIYGRGSSDMKAGLISALWAVKTLKSLGVKLNGDLYCSSSVGEESAEGETIGAASIIRRGYRPDFVVVGEGTNLEARIAGSSIFMFELKVVGKAVHGKCRNQVLYPQGGGLASGSAVGVDALDKALPIIEMIRRMETDWNHRWKHPVIGSGGHPKKDTQGIGAFCINPAIIKGGIYRSSINPILTIQYMVFHPPHVKREDVIEEIRRKVAAIAMTDDWLSENPPEITAPFMRKPWEGFDTPEDHEGIKVLKESFRGIMGEDLIITGMRAVSDCTWFDKLGVPSIMLGPGYTAQGVHGDNEYVCIDKVIDCTKLMAQYAADWCGLSL